MTILSKQEEAELEATIQKVAQEHGYLSNLMQTLALAPRGLASFSDFAAYTRYGSRLTELQRIVAMLIGVRDVYYGWMHMTPLARAAGISEEQIQLIREGRIPKDFTSTERALCAYAYEVAASRRVPPRVADEVHAHFLPRQIVDIALLTVQAMSMASLAVALDVPLEDEDVLKFDLDWQRQRTAAG